MIRHLRNQSETNRAFRRWVEALTSHSDLNDHHWTVRGRGAMFSNYGHGIRGAITTEVMLGHDPVWGDGVVKVVQPKAGRRDRGPATIMGRGDDGRLKLLREGRLQKNNLSRFVKDDFARLSGLTQEEVSVEGEPSKRQWFLVADLDGTAQEIVDQTIAFANGCARARRRAGGGLQRDEEDEDVQEYGYDEKGGVRLVTREGGTSEVRALQGYVYAALKRIVGKDLRKPKRYGYCVDGMIRPANVLIEIKTSTSSHSIYEAVGQLQLYPDLIGISSEPTKVLLVPDEPPVRAAMLAAVEAAGIEFHTYSIDDRGKKPRIAFTPDLIELCTR